MANNIREIITKAVIAKGKKRTLNKYPFSIAHYDKVLGCWISNHHYNATFKDGKPVVLGTFEVHLWYSNENDSNILKQTVSYMHELDLLKKEERAFNENDELIVSCKREPKCIDVIKNDTHVLIEIEKEITIQIVGQTLVRVETKNENESWDEIDNININENFLK